VDLPTVAALLGHSRLDTVLPMSFTVLLPVPGTWDDPIVNHPFSPYEGESLRARCRVCKRANSRHGDTARDYRDIRNRVIILADALLHDAGRPLSPSQLTQLMLETDEGRFVIAEPGTVHDNPSQFVGWCLSGWTETEPQDPVRGQYGPHRFGVPRDAVHIVRVAGRGAERLYGYAPSTVASVSSTVVAAAPNLNIRVARLEQLVDELRAEVADLRAQLRASLFGLQTATQ